MKKIKFAGELVRIYMEAGTWSQSRLAEEVGVNQTMISKIVLGDTTSDETAKKIAKVLNMSKGDTRLLIRQLHLDKMNLEIKTLNKKYEELLNDKVIKTVEKETATLTGGTNDVCSKCGSGLININEKRELGETYVLTRLMRKGDEIYIEPDVGALIDVYFCGDCSKLEMYLAGDSDGNWVKDL